MIKIIYYEKSRPGDTPEYFVRRWRMHGGFAMQFREFWDPIQTYIQNDCLTDTSAFPGAKPAFGGVGELYYSDLKSCQSSLATPNMAAIIADGGQVFARDKDAVHMIAEVRSVLAGVPGRIRLFVYAARPDGVNRHAFSAALEDAVAACAAKGDGFAASACQISIAHSVEELPGHESVIDFSYNAPADAAAGHASWLEQVANDDFLAGVTGANPLKLVTHSCIYYDKNNFGEL
jgi:hypothetical protein